MLRIRHCRVAHQTESLTANSLRATLSARFLFFLLITQKERHFTPVFLLIAKCLSIFSRVVPRDYSINFCFAYDSKRIRQKSIFLRIPLTRSNFLKDVGIVSNFSEYLLIKRLHRRDLKLSLFVFYRLYLSIL